MSECLSIIQQSTATLSLSFYSSLGRESCRDFSFFVLSIHLARQMLLVELDHELRGVAAKVAADLNTLHISSVSLSLSLSSSLYSLLIWNWTTIENERSAVVHNTVPVAFF